MVSGEQGLGNRRTSESSLNLTSLIAEKQIHYYVKDGKHPEEAFDGMAGMLDTLITFTCTA